MLSCLSFMVNMDKIVLTLNGLNVLLNMNTLFLMLNINILKNDTTMLQKNC